MLTAAFYTVLVLVGLLTAMPPLARETNGGQTSSSAGNLYSQHVCGADIMPSTVSFVEAHGYRVAPSTHHYGCASAVVTTIHICVVWVLVASALGWGIVFLIRCFARMAHTAEDRDAERAEIVDHPRRGVIPLTVTGDISARIDEAVALQTHHGYIELEGANRPWSETEPKQMSNPEVSRRL